jgi:hypothetical protein
MVMLTLRGVYDGKTFRILPTEPLPAVEREVPVAIVFLEDIEVAAQGRDRQVEAAKRMRAAREVMPPLGINIKDLIEEGRER